MGAANALRVVSTEHSEEEDNGEEESHVQSQGEFELEIENEGVGGEVGVVSEGVSERERRGVEPEFHREEEAEEVGNLLHDGSVAHRDIEILDEGDEVLGHLFGVYVFEEREELHGCEEGPQVVEGDAGGHGQGHRRGDCCSCGGLDCLPDLVNFRTRFAPSLLSGGSSGVGIGILRGGREGAVSQGELIKFAK